MYGSWLDCIPSRFVDELPGQLVDINSDLSSGYSAGRSAHWDSSGFTPAPRKTSFYKPSAQSTKSEKKDAPAISRGSRVMHDKFGAGTVIHIDGHKLDIEFDRGGNKRVMDSFVKKVEG